MDLDMSKRAYSEVDAFINVLDEEDRGKIPIELIDYFRKEKDNDYVVDIDADRPINEQLVNDKTYTIIAYLYLKYICESEEEKNRLKNIYIHNELVYQKELGEKYNPDDLFKNSKKSEEEREEKNELTDVKEESFFKKIINRIRNLFVKK